MESPNELTHSQLSFGGDYQRLYKEVGTTIMWIKMKKKCWWWREQADIYDAAAPHFVMSLHNRVRLLFDGNRQSLGVTVAYVIGYYETMKYKYATPQA